ncbi:MAG TPA: hypothetical protein VF457_11775 [Burkholderiaceae bacterium]
MKPLKIGFGAAAKHARRTQAAAGASFVAAAGVLAFALSQGADLQRQVDDVHASVEALTSPDTARAVPRAMSASEARARAERVASVNAAVMRLNLPWPDMLDQIEQAGTPQVSLVAIEPDVHRGVVRLVGEASGPDGMVDYVSRLAARPAFASAVILKHRAAGGRALEFTLELAWREAEKEPR